MAFSRKQFQDEFKELFFWEVGTVFFKPQFTDEEKVFNVPTPSVLWS